MTTKHLLAAAAALTLLASGAHAAETYAGGDLGLSHWNVDCAGTTRCDRDGTSINVYGGYGLGNGWALELGYISYGESTLKDPTLAIKVESAGLKLGVAYLAPINRDWGLTMRLGAVNMTTKLTATQGLASGSVSETNLTPYFGLGAAYNLSKTVKLTGGLEFSRAEVQGDKGDLRALSVGARVAF